MAEQNEEGAMIESQTLNLICIDASEHSNRALNWYFKNHHRQGDQVGLVHIYVLPDLPPFSIHGGLSHISVYESTMQESIDKCKAFVEEYKDVCIQKKVAPKLFVKSMNDSVGNTVCEIAKQNNATMIVIGQRGIGTLRRTFLGSVSDYIIHHTHVPVILVPPKEE